MNIKKKGPGTHKISLFTVTNALLKWTETPLAVGLVKPQRGIRRSAKTIFPEKDWVLIVIGWMHSGLHLQNYTEPTLLCVRYNLKNR